MPELPLLVFPAMTETLKTNGRGFSSKLHFPSYERQIARLAPQFQALQEVINARNIEIQQSLPGIDPEHVLVFETIGGIDDFANAVAKIQGFEWMGEFDIEDIEPDEEFYPLNGRDERVSKLLSGKLYLVMSNGQAISQLISLWNRFNQDRTTLLPHGLNKFKDIFNHLKVIRRWDIEDRFDESKILDIWKERIEIAPQQPVHFEIELWYRKSAAFRQETESAVRQIITNLNGRILQTCEINEISYHSILAELPVNEIENIIRNRDIDLVKCEYIMFFRPTGQMIIDEYEEIEQEAEENEDIQIPQKPLPSGEPIIGIFDGYPMSNHSLLSDRLIIDDPDNFESQYSVDERKHGTAMCSLIINGDLDCNENPISTPLYVRPIMKPHSFSHVEFVPDDFLLVDKIHSAVRQMFEAHDNQEATAPSIKIINFSIGDRDRIFYRTMSPLARLFDWLSVKYNVLFIISSGNHTANITLDIPRPEFDQIPKEEKEKMILHNIVADLRNRRLMSPAESINSITVGSIHGDHSTISANEVRLDPFIKTLPAPYTAFGNGYRRSIKPDMVYYGGKKLFEIGYGITTELKPSGYKRAPGIKVAAPDPTLVNTWFESGTSCSTALISRNAHFCFETIKSLRLGNDLPIPDNKIAILIKAMLIHGCSWGEISDNIESYTKDLFDWRKSKDLKTRWIGYGFPDFNKALSCTDQRVTILGFGEINAGVAHVFKFPLPPSLSAQTVNRRLTITLAWFSSIASNLQKYRVGKLWFETMNTIADRRENADDRAVKRGTVQHEIFVDDKAKAFIDGDSIEIKVNCDIDAKKFEIPISYSIMVTLETALPLPLYQEVRDRISIPIQLGQQV